MTYATTLAFYLHLRASEKYARKPELLRDHPIISRLLTLKQSLATLEDLNIGLSDSDLDSDGSIDEDVLMADARMIWSSGQREGLESNELAYLLKEAEEALSSRKATRDKKHKTDEVKPSSEERPKKKRKTASNAKSSSSSISRVVFDVAEPDLSSFNTSKSAVSRSAEDASSDMYGEATSLHAVDAADKQARKRSLRFHTSRIESTSARRQGARKAAMGGDDDIPYRERRREREERIRKETENSRKKGLGGDDLDDAEPEPRAEESNKKKKRARNEDEEAGSDDDGAGGYYDLVQRQSKEKKEKKKVEYEALRAASRFVASQPIRTRDHLLTHEVHITPQTRFRRRHHRRASFPHTGHSEEQRSHAAAREKRAQPQSQKAREIREGEEETCVSKSCLQGRPGGDRAVRGREVRYFSRGQECSFIVLKARTIFVVICFLIFQSGWS